MIFYYKFLFYFQTVVSSIQERHKDSWVLSKLFFDQGDRGRKTIAFFPRTAVLSPFNSSG